MSEEVWKRLGIPRNNSVTVSMQAANGATSRTLGLVENLPFDFDGIKLYLHVHVVKDAPYDILLGRPFDILTKSRVENGDNEEQLITISDPNSAKTLTFSTEPRGVKPIYNTPEEDTGF